MSTLTVAFVGTGADPDTQDDEGYAMAYRHASAFAKLDAELVACADVVPENATAFANQWGIDDANVFADAGEMAAAVDPDVVCVTTPPHTHADLVCAVAQRGDVDAVHCEKPMARTWGEATRMAEVCEVENVQLTVNHQRRFGEPYREAKRLLDAGEIGTLERVEGAAPLFYDYGSHTVDLCHYFNDEGRADWVLSQLDYSEENVWFGAHNANQVVATWRYENGVDAMVATGDSAELVDCHHRLVGSDGVIEIGRGFPDDDADYSALRVRRDGREWESVPTDEGLHGADTGEFGRAYIDRAIAATVEALERGDTPELSADHALRATEVLLGAYESTRSRGRVTVPLEFEDNPLDAMVESGALSPQEE